MPGFYISNLNKDIELNIYANNNSVRDNLEIDSFYIKRCTLSKFLNDKCFVCDEQLIILAEGVILNKTDLYQHYHVSTVDDLIKQMYADAGETFFEKFRGSFSGALYDRKERKWIVYTNHYGDNTVFFSVAGENIVISSQVDWIFQTLKNNDREITVNKDAIQSILTYGYMVEDYTYANEVKRLYPGHYLVYKNGNIKVKRYFSIKPSKYDLTGKTEIEIIEEIDKRFRRAVGLEYEKDREYGYKHLAQLSGGLDSRLCLWVAKDLGFDNILCMTFAQSNSLDESISKQIARDLNLNHLEWQLDSAGHLLNIEEYVSMNFGLAIYGGIGAEKEILDTVDINQFGLVHTGQIGDVVIGCFLSDEKELSNMSPGGLYSYILEPAKVEMTRFTDKEEYLMFCRGFMGCLSSHLYTRNYTEVSSPFLDIDLFEYCMSIPIALRRKHMIYKKWILSKYPAAAKYIWEKTGKRINKKDQTLGSIIKKAVKNPKLALSKIGFPIKPDNRIMSGMNPMDLWWKSNQRFRSTYNTFFDSGINSKYLPDEYRDILNKVYRTGVVIDKMLCITVLASIRLYFEQFES